MCGCGERWYVCVLCRVGVCAYVHPFIPDVLRMGNYVVLFVLCSTLIL